MKSNPLMIILIILVVALIGAVGFLGYMMMNQMNKVPNTLEAKMTQKIKKDEASIEGTTFKAQMENLVLNITNSKGREKLMKLSFSLKSTEPTVEMIVADNKEEIMDIVIQQISARSSEELLTVGGKELLKEELLNEINIILNEATVKNEDIKRNMIQKLFFTTFVIK
jgi:flagellar FliL protein